MAGGGCGLLALGIPLGWLVDAALLAEESMVVFSGDCRGAWCGVGDFSVVAVVRVDGGRGSLFKRMLVSLADAAKKMGRKCGCLFSRQSTSCGSVVTKAGRKRRCLSRLLVAGSGSGRRRVSAGSEAKAEA